MSLWQVTRVPLRAVIHDPWFVPETDELHELAAWAEARLSDGVSLGPNPVAVARCRHCGDIVFAVDRGEWALVHSQAGLQDAVADAWVERFARVADIAEVMEQHSPPES